MPLLRHVARINATFAKVDAHALKAEQPSTMNFGGKGEFETLDGAQKAQVEVRYYTANIGNK